MPPLTTGKLITTHIVRDGWFRLRPKIAGQSDRMTEKECLLCSLCYYYHLVGPKRRRRSELVFTLCWPTHCKLPGNRRYFRSSLLSNYYRRFSSDIGVSVFLPALDIFAHWMRLWANELSLCVFVQSIFPNSHFRWQTSPNQSIAHFAKCLFF